MTSSSTRTRAALALLTALSLAGCEEFFENLPRDLQGAAEREPVVDVGALEMRHGPSLQSLAAYYCPIVVTDPLVRLGCTVALGPQPLRSSLFFEFGVTLRIHNPNNFPVPAADVLVGLTLFDGLDAQALGAICISLCGEDDLRCDGSPRPGACELQAGDILTIDDFIHAIPGLIADIASGRAAEELRNSTILAGGDITLDLAFLLGVDEALTVFQRTALSYVDALLSGRDASLSVPVSVAGTVFFRLPVLGRIGVGYGPFRSTWRIL